MEIAVLVLFIVIGLAVIGVCIMSTLNFLGIQSIKNDLDSLKEKTRLLEQASGIGDVSQVLNEINVEREKIDNLQLFIDTTVMNQIQDNTTQATKANDDLGIFQNSTNATLSAIDSTIKTGFGIHETLALSDLEDDNAGAWVGVQEDYSCPFGMESSISKQDCHNAFPDANVNANYTYDQNRPSGCIKDPSGIVVYNEHPNGNLGNDDKVYCTWKDQEDRIYNFEAEIEQLKTNVENIQSQNYLQQADVSHLIKTVSFDDNTRNLTFGLNDEVNGATQSTFFVNIPEVDDIELNAKITQMESTVESLQDQIGSGNDLSEHINVTNSYADNCNYYGGGFDYYGNLCDPEIVFSTQGTPRWKISKNGNLIPIDNDTYDIGSAEYKVRDIFEAD